MKFVYLDKKDRVRAWFTPRHSLLLTASAALLLLIPVRHDTVVGRFTLEPVDRAVVRAEVPGVITEVHAGEGERVDRGATLLRLRNLPLSAQLARSEAEYRVASGRATSAAMHYTNFGAAAKEQERFAAQTSVLSLEATNLRLASPISGVVLTPRLNDRLGTYVTEGTELAEVGDLSRLRARIYVSEHDMYKLNLGSQASLQVEGLFEIWEAQALNISPLSTEIDLQLQEQIQYQGLRPPNFYVVDLVAANADLKLLPGMIGTARIYGPRRSTAGFLWEEVRNFLGRKIW